MTDNERKALEAFPLIKLAKKLKAYPDPSPAFGEIKMFPLIKLAKKLKVSCC